MNISRNKKKQFQKNMIQFKDFKFIKCTTEQRRSRYLKIRTQFSTQTSKQNITELESYIFQFTRKSGLTHHYRNSNIVNESFVKLELTYTPKPNENANLENICKELEHTKISLFKTKDNLHTLRKGLDSPIRMFE